jgi:hypothetical protein
MRPLALQASFGRIRIRGAIFHKTLSSIGLEVRRNRPVIDAMAPWQDRLAYSPSLPKAQPNVSERFFEERERRPSATPSIVSRWPADQFKLAFYSLADRHKEPRSRPPDCLPRCGTDRSYERVWVNQESWEAVTAGYAGAPMDVGLIAELSRCSSLSQKQDRPIA